MYSLYEDAAAMDKFLRGEWGAAPTHPGEYLHIILLLRDFYFEEIFTLIVVLLSPLNFKSAS
jgi:hypothetical protein